MTEIHNTSKLEIEAKFCSLVTMVESTSTNSNLDLFFGLMNELVNVYLLGMDSLNIMFDCQIGLKFVLTKDL